MHWSLYVAGVIGDWTRNQCITVAQLCTGHYTLLAAYLHHIGRRDSVTCPHCNRADEAAEHLVLHCLMHDQASRESWPNLHYQSDLGCLWSLLESIVLVTCPPTRNERALCKGLEATCSAVGLVSLAIFLQHAITWTVVIIGKEFPLRMQRQ